MKEKSFRVSGIVKHQNIEMGFWSIIGTDGQKYRPINFPSQLKKEGKRVTITARNTVGEMSIFMWGKSVEIVGFST